MAHNPFLSMGEPIAPVAAEALNPFMMVDTEQEMISSDNPFATSNPFSDFGATYEPPIGDTVPMDIFGKIETIADEAHEYNNREFGLNGPFQCFSSPPSETGSVMIKPTELNLSSTNININSGYLSDEDLQKPKRPPPLPMRPLPPETQNLILSVTGQMDFTSSHLLDRIPPTRTPSPVSMRDIHSPSPTPEPDISLEEDIPQEQNIFSSPPKPEPVLVPSTGQDILDVNQNPPRRPTRPPPARPLPPAPRPPPPRPAPPPVLPQQNKTKDDDINLFDAPVPTTIKPTKEDILSLYNKKEEVKPVDFLSDDIVDDICKNDVLETEQDTPLNITAPGEQTNTVDSTHPTLDFRSTPEEVEQVADTEMGMVAMECSEAPTTSETEPGGFDSFQDISNHTLQSSPFVDLQPVTEESSRSEALFQQDINESLRNPFEDIGNDFETAEAMPMVSPFANETSFGTAAAVESQSTFETAQVMPIASPFANETSFGTGAAVESQSKFETAQAMPIASPFANETSFGTGAAVESQSWGATEPLVEDAVFPESQDAFDAFAAKFDSTFSSQTPAVNAGAWGDSGGGMSNVMDDGFEAEAFDPFLSMSEPPAPAATPRLETQTSQDSGDDTFTLVIRPKESGIGGEAASVPPLAPPPRPQALPEAPRVNPFDAGTGYEKPQVPAYEEPRRRSEGGDEGAETPPTPLFDEDTSMPLEDFPRSIYSGPGWEMQLRQPNKKKITGQRFWKKVFVRLAYQGDNPVVQLLNSGTDNEPFQELPLQPCYSVSEISAQQYDQYGKIFTVKLQYVFYKERPGVRPGQVTKAERITNKLSQFAAYAIQGDYQGVKEFGSDLRKLGLPVEHAPQLSQLFKLGSLSYEDVKQFSCCIEEALFRLPAHRDRALTYKMEEVQITAVDELYVEQDAEGSVLKQIARVRLFFLGFLSGMPDVEIGVNDLRRQGREVVGRHDIIPVVTEEWIRVEGQQFHACVQPHDFADTQIIKFKPPDACYVELMRFRVRPPKNRELPLQLKAVWCVTGNKVELRADVLVPGFASRKLGQVPCEDVSIRFPIPECWIYLFRVEKHFRYGSVKSAHRRTGKIKGIERLLGAVDNLQESLIEVTSGQAKYEHQHRAIVWRMPRLPKEGQGAYTTHNLVCRMALTSYDQIPPELARWALVEFTMPATQVSHMTVRSVSLQQYDDDPPEKYVRYLARHEYKVGIERTSGQTQAAYAVVTATSPRVEVAPAPPPPPAAPSSDSDSD